MLRSGRRSWFATEHCDGVAYCAERAVRYTRARDSQRAELHRRRSLGRSQREPAVARISAARHRRESIVERRRATRVHVRCAACGRRGDLKQPRGSDVGRRVVGEHPDPSGTPRSRPRTSETPPRLAARARARSRSARAAVAPAGSRPNARAWLVRRRKRRAGHHVPKIPREAPRDARAPHPSDRARFRRSFRAAAACGGDPR